MIIFDKLTIRNFKCFDEEGITIDTLKKINVIIGKNNSGKSSVIETFQFLTSYDKSFFLNRRNGKSPEIEFEHTVNEECIKLSFPANMIGGSITGNHQTYGLTLVNSIITYSIDENGQKKFKSIDKQIPNTASTYFETYVARIASSIKGKRFCHLSAERDIQQETSASSLNMNINGNGATNLLQTIINRDKYDSNLIEHTLLDKLNEILRPDIEFKRLLVQLNDQNNWEIYFESTDDGRIPLAKMGSGIKTVLLVLIILYVIPSIEEKSTSEYLFALEELENNLHPSLQRRLYNFIYNFAKTKNCIFLLTTHSSIVIDLFNSLVDTQILHVSKDKNRTTITSNVRKQELNRVLDDLDVRASDILQSNGIIWVEGPSDRTYINHWLEIMDGTLKEGNHYSVMFYGGKLLSNLSFDYEIFNRDLIPLLKLNRNSFVVMDRDGKTVNPKLNDTKRRIQNEIGENATWITKGREIENYISNNALETWLSNRHSISCIFDNDINKKLEDNISRITKAKNLRYNIDKNKYASEIISFINQGNINNLDLKQNIERIIRAIRKWNKM